MYEIFNGSTFEKKKDKSEIDTRNTNRNPEGLFKKMGGKRDNVYMCVCNKEGYFFFLSSSSTLIPYQPSWRPISSRDFCLVSGMKMYTKTNATKARPAKIKKT